MIILCPNKTRVFELGESIDQEHFLQFSSGGIGIYQIAVVAVWLKFFMLYVNGDEKVRSSVPTPALHTSDFILRFSKGMSVKNRSNPEHSAGCFLCLMPWLVQ